MEIEVIKFEPQDEAAHEIIAYRHPREDVSNQAQLLVAPSQVALFINEGDQIEVDTRDGSYVTRK